MTSASRFPGVLVQSLDQLEEAPLGSTFTDRDGDVYIKMSDDTFGMMSYDRSNIAECSAETLISWAPLFMLRNGRGKALYREISTDNEVSLDVVLTGLDEECDEVHFDEDLHLVIEDHSCEEHCEYEHFDEDEHIRRDDHSCEEHCEDQHFDEDLHIRRDDHDCSADCEHRHAQVDVLSNTENAHDDILLINGAQVARRWEMSPSNWDKIVEELT